MGSLWRSQEMCLAQLFIQSDAAYETVCALGEQGLVQFKDLNPEVNAFQRKYVNEVRRCEEMDRKIRFFETEITKMQMFVSDCDLVEDVVPERAEIPTMEAELTRYEKELKEINANEETLSKQDLELVELSEILAKSGVFFDEAEGYQGQVGNDEPGDDMPLMREDASTQLSFVTGVIVRDKLPGFERLLWRACRGNVFLRKAPIDKALKDPVSGDMVQKEVFIVFFQGQQLQQRVQKICDGYNASVYPCPASAAERRELAIGVRTRIQDLQTVLGRTADHRRQLLNTVNAQLPEWTVKVKKIKAIYYTMNKFNIDSSRKCLIAECWCPTARLGDIRAALRQATSRADSPMEAILNRIKTKEKPPTYHLTNKFTEGFQSLVDAYGVASYQEVNPGCFALITFPFLFAVMFGDCGHGIIMTLAAGFIIAKESSLARWKGGGEMWTMLFGGRYIIFLMGLFSIYTGFFYNDFFSKSLTLANSGWTTPADIESLDQSSTVKFKPYGNGTDFDYAYPLGIDPIWQLAQNKLIFINSFKMKMSVILGFFQMGLGVVLSFFNHTFFKKKLNIFTEFIPQILFLTCIFGYLVVMIVYKWVNSTFPNKYGNPPSLLLMLINMFLKFGSPIEDKEVLYGDEAGNTQKNFQMFLVVVSLICIPWMLIPKPFILRAQARRKEAGAATRHSGGEVLYSRAAADSSSSLNSDGDDAILPMSDGVEYDDDGDDGDHGSHGGHGGKFEFGEVMVHQAIHTIEFCLGTISNTASYLRLWALSLAHAQLSEVLWEMVLHRGFANPAILFFAFGMWAVLTIAVLLIMEGLSAFLHALRLHWVEFQSKFYEGEGYKFIPFSFKRVLAGQMEE